MVPPIVSWAHPHQLPVKVVQYKPASTHTDQTQTTTQLKLLFQETLGHVKLTLILARTIVHEPMNFRQHLDCLAGVGVGAWWGWETVENRKLHAIRT